MNITTKQSLDQAYESAKAKMKRDLGVTLYEYFGLSEDPELEHEDEDFVDD